MRGLITRWGIGAGLAIALAGPGAAHANAATGGPWQAAESSQAEIAPGIAPENPSVFRLDQPTLRGVLSGAPAVVSIPAPNGGLERFAVSESPVLEPKIAADHPAISTYAGRGIDDETASIRLSLTPLGFHASVFSDRGAWYVDPLEDSPGLYASYARGNLPEGARPSLTEKGSGLSLPAPDRSLERNAARGGTPVIQRTYRLALANDPTYAAEFGNDAAVLAAKVVLINRVNQIYNDDLAIKLVLIDDPEDKLNLDTPAEYGGANGPCGAAPCFTESACSITLLRDAQIAIGQLAGASNFDIGHLVLGSDGGGIALFGVGKATKAGGCTGVNPPVGDPFAVDYVAHEMGHQFSAPHTFNGVVDNCEVNRDETESVEPGSGSSVMSYAGICGADDLQAHNDPYFSQRSIETIGTYVASDQGTVNEAQVFSLTGFDGTDSFQISYEGANSPTITNGTNYTAAGIEAAIESIPGWPAGANVGINSFQGTGTPTLTGFTVRFMGTLAGTDVSDLGLESISGFTGFVGERAQGGPAANGGSELTTANNHPVVSAPAGETIPVRTPFSLEGQATDSDGDPLVFTWEQNDAGEGPGTALFANTKPNGPLFRLFSTPSDTFSNAASAEPSRTFPDMAQIAAGNTNAATGNCPANNVECFSEFLPTAAYANAFHFRLTARDLVAGGGGVGSDDVTLNLADSAGPFRVTSQSSPATVASGSSVPVTWNVAGTAAAPVNANDVSIHFSTDGGLTYPTELVASTPNDGSHTVTVPNTTTTQGRFRVQAVDNVFFDISHANLTVEPGSGDTDPPETTIVDGPKDKVKLKKGKKKAKVNYEYGSDETPVTYECNINGTGWEPCFDKTFYKLGKGKWTLEARATDAAGNVDPTPVSDTIKVKKKKKG